MKTCFNRTNRWPDNFKNKILDLVSHLVSILNDFDILVYVYFPNNLATSIFHSFHYKSIWYLLHSTIYVHNRMDNSIKEYKISYGKKDINNVGKALLNLDRIFIMSGMFDKKIIKNLKLKIICELVELDSKCQFVKKNVKINRNKITYSKIKFIALQDFIFNCKWLKKFNDNYKGVLGCLLYTSPSPRDS